MNQGIQEKIAQYRQKPPSKITDFYKTLMHSLTDPALLVAECLYDYYGTHSHLRHRRDTRIGQFPYSMRAQTGLARPSPPLAGCKTRHRKASLRRWAFHPAKTNDKTVKGRGGEQNVDPDLSDQRQCRTVQETGSETVQKLADSISKVELLNPITVDQEYSVDDLKNPNKDRRRTPDIFLMTFSFFCKDSALELKTTPSGNMRCFSCR